MAPKQLALSYNAADSENSALDLVYQVHPHWKNDLGPVKIMRFTDGIMNTVFPFHSLFFLDTLLTSNSC